MTWGYEFRWGDLSYRAGGFPTREAMEKERKALIEEMKARGWTRPRWWQFWRSRDTRP